jgi:hypothetical protein
VTPADRLEEVYERVSAYLARVDVDRLARRVVTQWNWVVGEGTMAGLVLWDVDHSLIDTRGVGRELSATAFLRSTNCAAGAHLHDHRQQHRHQHLR